MYKSILPGCRGPYVFAGGSPPESKKFYNERLLGAEKSEIHMNLIFRTSERHIDGAEIRPLPFLSVFPFCLFSLLLEKLPYLFWFFAGRQDTIPFSVFLKLH